LNVKVWVNVNVKSQEIPVEHIEVQRN